MYITSYIIIIHTSFIIHTNQVIIIELKKKIMKVKRYNTEILNGIDQVVAVVIVSGCQCIKMLVIALICCLKKYIINL